MLCGGGGRLRANMGFDVQRGVWDTWGLNSLFGQFVSFIIAEHVSVGSNFMDSDVVG